MSAKIIFLLCAFLPCSIWAQWNNEDSIVFFSNPFEQAVSGIKSCVTDDGHIWVAYTTNTSSYLTECRIQLLDENGNRVFGEDGLSLISDSQNLPSNVGSFGITCDSEGNAIICFPSAINTSSYLPIPRVFKINADGEFLWDNDGQTLPINSDNITGQGILNLNDEIYATWNYSDYSQGIISRSCIVKLTATGEAAWDNVITINGKFAEYIETERGFSALWIENSMAWMQNYDSNGEELLETPILISEKDFTVIEPYASSPFIINSKDNNHQVCFTGYSPEGNSVLYVANIENNQSTLTYLSSEQPFSNVQMASDFENGKTALIWQNYDYDSGASMHVAMLPEAGNTIEFITANRLTPYYATFNPDGNIFLLWGEAEGWSEEIIKCCCIDSIANILKDISLFSTIDNFSSSSIFNIKNNAYILMPYTQQETYTCNLAGMRIPLNCDFSTTGINKIDNENISIYESATEYFTLDGLRIARENIQPGLYIKRTPAGTSKVYINSK